METLAVALEEYKETIGFVASVTTTLQFFSGAFICKDIYKKGNTSNVDVTPFIGGVAIGIIMLQYGLMLNDSAMIQVNIAGITLSSVYCLFYFYFTTDYSDSIKKASYATVLVAVLIGYTRLEDKDLIENRLGFIITVLMLALIGSPLLQVGEIIQTRNAERLPFPMIVSGTIVTFEWLLYGIILRNNFMILQNIAGFILSFIQLVLCIMYWGNTSQTNPGHTRKDATAKKSAIERSVTDNLGESSKSTGSKDSNKKSRTKKAK